MYKKTLLVNANGNEFYGWSEHDLFPTTGELIFNTAMSGFVEILSDPSYINQIVSFTSSHIGNYGLSMDDFESSAPQISAAIGNSFTNNPSSWRNEKSLTSWLKEYEIPYSGGFDIRAITKYIRSNGSQIFAIGTENYKEELIDELKKAKNIIGDNSALTAGSLKNKFNTTEGKVGIIDLGTKKSIVNVLENHNLQVVFIKPQITAQEIKNMKLKGLLISNGPGDPRSLTQVISTVRELIGTLPIFGICLGHQILGLACGLIVEKLDFGHHGSNHPVKIQGIKKALITSQNHGFAVQKINGRIEHKKFGQIETYATNLNDGSNEGLSIWDSLAYSVQFHPESGPGTSDGLQIFDPFIELMENYYAKK